MYIITTENNKDKKNNLSNVGKEYRVCGIIKIIFVLVSL